MIAARTCANGGPQRRARQPSGGRGGGESHRVAGVVVGHLVVADLDRGGQVGEQRPGRGSASAAAAMLPISSRAVRSGSTSASAGRRPRSGRGHRLRRRSVVRSRSAGSTSGAAGGPHWCRGPVTTRRAGRAAAGFAGVDLLDRHCHSPDRRDDHRILTFTAGEYSSWPAHQPGPGPTIRRRGPRRWRDVETEADRAAGGQDRAAGCRGDPVPGAPRADQMGLDRQGSVRVGADDDAQPRARTGSEFDVGRPVDEVHQSLAGWGVDGDRAHVFHDLSPCARQPSPVMRSCARIG
ncbi:hypothetical protein I553_3989 [Mycobacterium xenopi 4042]|uniref:Uncharacterized protein n=1 Tax=Mycobacterium xenopi 4042 TaxID=1299334 RepID=X8DEQ5_MYCXE|nr:hypothetical protein I553_3989 [Mycobacterium xenopi 4042]